MTLALETKNISYAEVELDSSRGQSSNKQDSFANSSNQIGSFGNNTDQMDGQVE